MRIAIVDDIKEERDKLADVLTKQLSRRGIHVNLFEFENGEDFLIAAKERPFTVVFLDIYMSGANGIETARELRTFDFGCTFNFYYHLLRIMLWMGSRSVPCTTL
mgnify:CR=1 FL=1